MPKPWEKYGAASAPAPAAKPWERYNGAPQQPQRSGSILPISTTPEGDWQFDSNAGIVGAIKRAVMLPGDVYTGKVQMTDPETGRTSEEAIRRSAEMAGVVTPVSPALRAGEGVMGTAITKRAPVEPPTPQMLKQAGGEGFDQARGMAVTYRGDVVKAMSERFSKELYDQGFDAGNAPKTFAVLNGRLNADGSGVSVRDMLAARAALKNARTDFNNPPDKAAAEWLVKRIDAFLEAGHPGTVVAGTAPADAKMVGTLSREANANYAAGKRSEILNKLETDATRRADAANSGLNLDNTIRARTASILERPKLTKGHTPEEIAAMEGVTRGSFLRNRARGVGNKLGGGGGLGATMLGAGAGTGVGMSVDPMLGMAVGVGVPTLGYGARKAANAMARKSLRKVDEMTRRRSPLYEDMMKDAPIATGNIEGRAALIRALLAQQPREKN